MGMIQGSQSARSGQAGWPAERRRSAVPDRTAPRHGVRQVRWPAVLVDAVTLGLAAYHRAARYPPTVGRVEALDTAAVEGAPARGSSSRGSPVLLAGTRARAADARYLVDQLFGFGDDRCGRVSDG
jgi:hypothetical protein